MKLGYTFIYVADVRDINGCLVEITSPVQK